jgi:hypothetical protein
VPLAVLVEDSEPERSAAELWARHGGSLPIFLRQPDDRWEYFGFYEFVRFSTEPADIKRENRAGRPGPVGVLYLRAAPVEDRPWPDRRL